MDQVKRTFISYIWFLSTIILSIVPVYGAWKDDEYELKSVEEWPGDAVGNRGEYDSGTAYPLFKENDARDVMYDTGNNGAARFSKDRENFVFKSASIGFVQKWRANRSLCKGVKKHDIAGCVYALGRRADVDVRGEKGSTPLSNAVLRHDVDMVKVLLDSNVLVNKNVFNRQETILDIVACLEGRDFNARCTIATMLVLAGGMATCDYTQSKIASVIEQAYGVKELMGEQDWLLEDMLSLEILDSLFPKGVSSLIGEYASIDTGDNAINELCGYQIERNRAFRLIARSTTPKKLEKKQRKKWYACCCKK